MNIGFDLDGIFVDHPPLVPKSIIEWLYKKKGNGLSYRFPGKLEQKIRILSHIPILRPPIRNNLKSLRKADMNNLFLVSSRFSFLKEMTFEWDKKNNIFSYFKKVYFNDEDKQPHLFKDEIIKREKITEFVDDDLDLLFYLARQNPNVCFFWLSTTRAKIPLPPNIKSIRSLEDFFINYV